MKESLALEAKAMAMALLLLQVASQAVAVQLLRRLPRRRLLAAQVCTLQGQGTTRSSFVALSVRCECSRSCPRQLQGGELQLVAPIHIPPPRRRP